MAQGDVVTGQAYVAHGSYLTYQPAAGESARITGATSGMRWGNESPSLSIMLGWSTVRLYNNFLRWRPLELYIDNTNYLRIQFLFGSGYSDTLRYWGVQIK
jgi:hypothetical protein